MVQMFLCFQEYKLGAVGIFTHTAREMAKNRHYGNMRQILDCVIKAGHGSDDTIDEIVGACLLVVADNPSEVWFTVKFLNFQTPKCLL